VSKLSVTDLYCKSTTSFILFKP